MDYNENDNHKDDTAHGQSISHFLKQLNTLWAVDEIIFSSFGIVYGVIREEIPKR